MGDLFIAVGSVLSEFLFCFAFRLKIFISERERVKRGPVTWPCYNNKP